MIHARAYIRASCVALHMEIAFRAGQPCCLSVSKFSVRLGRSPALQQVGHALRVLWCQVKDSKDLSPLNVVLLGDLRPRVMREGRRASLESKLGEQAWRASFICMSSFAWLDDLKEPVVNHWYPN